MPSGSHRAFGFRRYVTVIGGPADTVGSPASNGDGTKLFFSSSSIRRGNTWIGTSHCCHDEFAHCVIGLMHAGHSSAPMTRTPARFEIVADDLDAVRVDPEHATNALAAKNNTNARHSSWRRPLANTRPIPPDRIARAPQRIMPNHGRGSEYPIGSYGVGRMKSEGGGQAVMRVGPLASEMAGSSAPRSASMPFVLPGP